MGKKGVLLDNGKKAQSSMALYWRKHQEQSKQPKKQYQPTQQQQLDKRAESGFQKWKQHKQKIITKNFQKQKKQKAPPPPHNKHQTQQHQNQQFQQMLNEKMMKKSQITNIPGFKSKQSLKNRLKVQQKKQVNQNSNKLIVPSHLGQMSQQQILSILRAKKIQQNQKKQYKQAKSNNTQDVILGQNFIQSFMKKPEQQQKQKIKPIQQQLNKPVQNFFKSDILNQLSKGNSQVIANKTQPKQQNIIINQQIVEQKVEKDNHQAPISIHNSIDQVRKEDSLINSIFKSRILGNKK